MILAYISFSVLLVVGALCMTTNTAQRFFLAANVPVIATAIRRRRAANVERLEHLTGMCVHGHSHDPKKIQMRPIPKSLVAGSGPVPKSPPPPKPRTNGPW